jgi:hypothetical protein
MKLIVIIMAMLCVSTAYATTLLTFAVPDTGSYAFTFTATNTPNPGGTLIGSNSDIVVKILAGDLAGVYNDARFEIANNLGNPLQVTDSGGYPDALDVEGGILKIYDTSPPTEHLLLQANFLSATLEEQHLVSGDNALQLNNVTFSGDAAHGFTHPSSFSFTLDMNPPNAWGDNINWTATASFTSSATPVPEPATLLAAISGIAGIAVIIRKRIAR